MTFFLTFTIWKCIAYNRFCRDGIYFDKTCVCFVVTLFSVNKFDLQWPVINSWQSYYKHLQTIKCFVVKLNWNLGKYNFLSKSNRLSLNVLSTYRQFCDNFLVWEYLLLLWQKFIHTCTYRREGTLQNILFVSSSNEHLHPTPKQTNKQTNKKPNKMLFDTPMKRWI